MADDDIQVTTPLLQTFLQPVVSPRRVDRIRGLAPVSSVARAMQTFSSLQPVGDSPPRPATAPLAETHELLTPETAATLSQMHGVEAELMIRAMIEAAKSDGEIDAEERRRILTCLKDAGAADSDRQALLAAMTSPPDMDGLVARVTSPELALEVYSASLLAIQDDQPSEQRYLARLADRLKLSRETVAELHARFGDPPPWQGTT
ncbi:MAG: tellurite resistance TerB family protein [Pseudomonadota bacterium]